MRQEPGEKLHLLFNNCQWALLAAFQVLSLAAILTGWSRLCCCSRCSWPRPTRFPVAPVPQALYHGGQSRQKRRRANYYLSLSVSATHAGEMGCWHRRSCRPTAISTRGGISRPDQHLQLREFGGGAIFMTVTTVAFYVLWFGRVIIRTVEGALTIRGPGHFRGAVVRLRSPWKIV